jgi:hypothetical protein
VVEPTIFLLNDPPQLEGAQHTKALLERGSHIEGAFSG